MVCCGTDDVFTDAQLDAWRLTAMSEIEVLRFPGGHFYVEDQAEAVARQVAARLSAGTHDGAAATG